MSKLLKKLKVKDFHITSQPGGQIHVHLRGRPTLWATGSTRKEAMGNFERKHPDAQPTR